MNAKPGPNIKNRFKKASRSGSQSKKKSAKKIDVVIWAAIIGLIGTFLTVLATLGSAAITTFGSAGTKAAGGNTPCAKCPEVDWMQMARNNDWIPRSECPWDKFEGNGTDDSGKKVKVEIRLLSGEDRWVCGSAVTAELGGKPVDLSSIIHGLVINPDTKIIVALGMASIEGNPKR